MTSVGLLGDVMLGRGVRRHSARHRPPSCGARSCAALRLARPGGLQSRVLHLRRGEPTRRIPGKPFFFRAPRSPLRRCARSGCARVSLANNHALDYEAEALADTLVLLEEAGIAAGAGRGPMRPGGLRSSTRTACGSGSSASDHPAEYAAGQDTEGIAQADLSPLPALAARGLGLLRRALRSHHRVPALGAEHGGRAGALAAQPRQRAAGGGAELVAGHSAHVFHGVGWAPRGRC